MEWEFRGGSTNEFDDGGGTAVVAAVLLDSTLMTPPNAIDLSCVTLPSVLGYISLVLSEMSDLHCSGDFDDDGRMKIFRRSSLLFNDSTTGYFT